MLLQDRDAGPSGIVKVFVGNLATSVTWQELKDHMRQGGNVVHAAILTNPDGESKGCGIVDYATLHDARRAIRELNNTVLHGRTIFVREDRDRALPAEMGAYSGLSSQKQQQQTTTNINKQQQTTTLMDAG